MTTEIEKTKRELYGCLDRIRRAGKHRVLTAEFEERLEEHLEALRQDGEWMRKQLATIRQTNVDMQERLHAVDRAYFEQSQRNGDQARQIEKLEELNRIAGEELIRAQGMARQYDEDCRSAEKLSDDLSEKLTNATTVIGQQEQLIAGQRSAIAGMHAELTHSRVIRKAFIRAQEAFTAVDAALHESAPYNAQKALGDDLVDAELLP